MVSAEVYVVPSVSSWFAVHCTSMNNTNRLISGDNKGYASMLFEMSMNPKEVNGHVSNTMHLLMMLE